MTSKSGDDYAARVYLSFDVPPGRWHRHARGAEARPRAARQRRAGMRRINYIWTTAMRSAPGSQRLYRPHPHAGAAFRRDRCRRWVDERRDVAADFRHAFGMPRSASPASRSSDTDNTGEEARAGFADSVSSARMKPVERRPHPVHRHAC